MNMRAAAHFIRTSGQTESPPHPPPDHRYNRRSAPLAIGIDRTAPHCVHWAGPRAWPSTIRQPVRNDYGLLQALELGVRHLRVPAADLRDGVQSERLAILRDHGVKLTAQWLWSPGLKLAEDVAPLADQLDGIELQVLGYLWPSAEPLAHLHRCAASYDKPITLSCVVPGQNIPGKRHGRSQIGYLVTQLAELNECLAKANVYVDRVCCRWPAVGDEFTADFTALPTCSHIGAFDWIYGLPTGDEIAQANGAAATLFQMRSRPGDRLLVEPYVDFDRTMDAGLGLLDRRYNPRPAFHVLRHLNTLLFCEFAEAASTITINAYGGYRQLLDGQRLLILPESGGEDVPMSTNTVSALRGMQLNKEVGLCSGSSREPAGGTIREPSLFMQR
ncbi:MAG: hypothetical protein R2911_18885 [Caldilineaceae bacterium]